MPATLLTSQKAHAAGVTSLAFPSYTSVAGSVIVVQINSGTGPTLSVSDNKGNTYSQVGTTQANGGGGQTAVFIAQNVAGGSGCIVTANLSSASDPSIIMAERGNVLAACYDAASLVQNGGVAGSPYAITSNALAQADSQIVNCIGTSAGVNPSAYANVSGGSTLEQSETDGATYWTGAMFGLAVSATTAVTLSNSVANSSDRAQFIFALKASGGAPAAANVPPLLPVMGRTGRGERTGRAGGGIMPRLMFPMGLARSGAAGLATITATLAVTDATDTVASTAAVTVTTTTAVTDATDTLSSTAAVAIVASLTATDATDTLASTAAVQVVTTLALTDASDSMASVALVVVGASLALTDATDTGASTAAVTVTAALSLTDATDTLSASATEPVTAALSLADATDAMASAAAVAVVVNLALTDATDTLASTTTSGTSVDCTLSVTDATDTANSTAQVVVVASLSATDATDTLSAASTSTIVAALAQTDATDTVASAAAVAVVAALSITDATDTLSASTSSAGDVTTTLNVTDGNDTLAATVESQFFAVGGGMDWRRYHDVDLRPRTAHLAVTDDDDTVVATVRPSWVLRVVGARITDEDDTAAGAAVVVPWPALRLHRVHALERTDQWGSTGAWSPQGRREHQGGPER